MGMITELFNFVALGRAAEKKLNANPNDVKAVSSLFQKAKSISSQASKYVMEYPVACSTVISDYESALAIAKQVEFDCARFIILSSGLNPIVRQSSGDTVEAHISRLVSSAESQFRGLGVEITPATPEQIMSGEEFINNYTREEYSSYNKNTETTKLSYSIEDNNGPQIYKPGYYMSQAIKSGQNAISPPIGSRTGDVPKPDSYYEALLGQRPANFTETAPNRADFAEDQAGQDLYDQAINDYESKLNFHEAMIKDYDDAVAHLKKTDSLSPKSGVKVEAATLNAITDKLGKVGPTIVNLRLYVQGGDGTDRPIDMPLAIKSTLQFVDHEDIIDMLGQVDNKAKKLLDLIRLTSGEIKFFKDYLFALDSVKGDIERERSVGHTPFFRRLMSNKSKYRLKTVAQYIPFLEKMVTRKSQKDLPMCTIVIDESEMRDLKLRLSDCLKNRQKYIDPILDTYMLLGLGIVDANNGLIYFFYSGEEYPITCDITKVGKGGNDKDTNARLADAISNMSRLITKR